MTTEPWETIPPDDPSDFVGPIATTDEITLRVQGDTYPRLTVNADGKLEWGSGAAVADTNLYRSGAYELAMASTNLKVQGTVAQQVVIGNVASSVPGIVFGSAGDTNLYRSAPDALKTDDTFWALGDLKVGTNGRRLYDNGSSLCTNSQMFIEGSSVFCDRNFSVDYANSNYKLLFGSAGDTNLYRVQADTLKTDDNFNFGGNIVIGAQGYFTQYSTTWGYQDQVELASDPAAPAANYARYFTRDNGSGKTQACIRFNTGAVQVIATEP